jgi:hypothetical protein
VGCRRGDWCGGFGFSAESICYIYLAPSRMYWLSVYLPEAGDETTRHPPQQLQQIKKYSVHSAVWNSFLVLYSKLCKSDVKAVVNLLNF